jgi:uncharacterized phage-associated protein
MASVFDVADYFIANADRDEGITHLKLQKLCAYAQAFSLALNNTPLFKAKLEVWNHGPVVSKLYNQFRAYGKNPLSTVVTPEESRCPFTYEELFILELVNGYYGRYAAWTLRDMSHYDFPGDFDNPNRQAISIDEITSRFSEHKIVRKIKTEWPTGDDSALCA